MAIITLPLVKTCNMPKLMIVMIMKKILIIGLIFMVSSCATTFKSGMNAVGIKMDDEKNVKLDIKTKNIRYKDVFK